VSGSKIIFIPFYILVTIINVEDGFVHRFETKNFSFFSQYKKKEQNFIVSW